jgi:hypothetical protein
MWHVYEAAKLSHSGYQRKHRLWCFDGHGQYDPDCKHPATSTERITELYCKVESIRTAATHKSGDTNDLYIPALVSVGVAFSESKWLLCLLAALIHSYRVPLSHKVLLIPLLLLSSKEIKPSPRFVTFTVQL